VTPEEEERVLAATLLVGHTGAVAFEFGYANDSAVKVQDAEWYASAQYRGARVFVEGYPHPADAAEALARRLVEGGTCTHCGKTTTMSPQANPRRRCVYRRRGNRWVRGCLR
jgi:hypothetical protein